MGQELEIVKHVEEQIWDFHFVNIEIRVRGTSFWKSFSIMGVSKIAFQLALMLIPTFTPAKYSAFLFFHNVNTINEE